MTNRKRLFALKRQPVESDEAVRELMFFQTLSASNQQCKHLLRLHNFFVEGSELVMAFEYMRSSLWELFTRCQGFVDFDLCSTYSEHLLLALQHLHLLGVSHRDVSMKNCLLDPRENVLKVCDLGMAVCASSFVSDRVVCTLPYRPPEICLWSDSPTCKRTGADVDWKAVDIWSSGVLVAALHGKTHPFGGMQHGEKASHVLARQVEILGDPKSVWPEIVQFQRWQSICKNLRPMSGETMPLLCGSAEVTSVFERPLSSTWAEIVRATWHWRPDARPDAIAVLRQIVSISSSGGVVGCQAAPKDAKAASVSAAASLKRKAGPSSEAPSQDTSQDTGKRRDVQSTSISAVDTDPYLPPRNVPSSRLDVVALVCQCSFNCGEAACVNLRSRKYRADGSTPFHCTEAVQPGHSFCQHCRCHFDGCPSAAGVPGGLWCKKHYRRMQDAQYLTIFGGVNLSSALPWEVRMCVKHGAWLYRIQPCDVEAFLQAGKRLVTSSEVWTGEQLFQLVILAITKWPAAIQAFCDHSKNDVDDYAAAFQSASDAALSDPHLQFVHDQVDNGRCAVVQGLPHVLLKLNLVYDCSGDESLPHAPGVFAGARRTYRFFKSKNARVLGWGTSAKGLKEALKFAREAADVMLPSSSSVSGIQDFLEAAAAFLDGLPAGLVSAGENGYTRKHVLRKLLLLLAEERGPGWLDSVPLPQLFQAAPDVKDYASKLGFTTGTGFGFRRRTGLDVLWLTCWCCLFGKAPDCHRKSFESKTPSEVRKHALALKKKNGDIAPNAATLVFLCLLFHYLGRRPSSSLPPCPYSTNICCSRFALVGAH